MNLLTSTDMTPVTQGVLIVLISAAILKVLPLAHSLTKKSIGKLKANMDKPVPTNVLRNLQFLADVAVIAGLGWMLKRTIEVSPPVLGGWDVALIAGWTWAILSALQFLWKRPR